MTDKELAEEYNINLYFFDSDLWDRDGIYIKSLNTMFVSNALSDKEAHQVILHECGHKEHLPSLYKIAQLRCENEANRHMIHHLIKESLKELDDIRDFNYVTFMNYYNLKTVTDEIMIKEELQNLINNR